MKTLLRPLAALVAMVALANVALAQPEVQDSLSAVRKFVNALPNGDAPGDFAPLTDEAVKRVFPEQRFVVVRYRIYPVARIMPEGMRPANVFAVDKAGKLDRLKDVRVMETFFKNNAPPVKNDTDAKSILAAWLALTPEFHQDNMYKFETLEREFAGDKTKTSGRAIVKQGGNGELRAELTFDGAGKLAGVVEKAAIRPGPRPICQATKLLDADPIVRRMAEADLLIMGVSARDYLMEQRERARPEVRDAIDRLWQRIRANGW